MLWIKAFHIVFVSGWFAGLFYLPRIYVNLALAPPDSHAERERLLLMAGKLLRFTLLLSGVAIGLGAALWLGWGIGRGAGWMHAKLSVVLLVLGYQGVCAWLLQNFRRNRNRFGHRWFRVFNEGAVVLMTAAVVLVVVKPF